MYRETVKCRRKERLLNMPRDLPRACTRISLPSLRQCQEKKFDTWFWSFSSMISWSPCFGPVVRQYITTRSVSKAKRQNLPGCELEMSSNPQFPLKRVPSLLGLEDGSLMRLHLLPTGSITVEPLA